MVDCRASPDKKEAPRAGAADAGATGAESAAGAGGCGAGTGSGCEDCVTAGVTGVVDGVLEVVAAEDEAALSFGYNFVHVKTQNFCDQL